MPVFEYKCKKCNSISSFLEPQKSSIFDRLFNKKRCKKCGSKKLTKIMSSFTLHKTQTYAEMLDDISKMAPIQFVPDYRPKGPPPGGCPYEKLEKEEKLKEEAAKKKEKEKERERIVIS